MFRRREDSLFDNTTDPNQPESMEAPGSVNAPSSSAPASSASSSSSQPAYLQNTAPAQPQQQPAAAARPAAEPRPAAPQQASSFRPASQPTPLGADMNRNRMPESKNTMPASGNPASSMGSMTSMSNFGAKSGGKRVLTVGNDILLKGEIATCDRLVIEGRVDATLNDVHTVEIAETGSFKGSAHIEDAEISGLFEGDLIVRNRLVIYATGKVRGKITYGEIEIERGGEISGEIKTNNADSHSASARPSRHKEEKVAA